MSTTAEDDLYELVDEFTDRLNRGECPAVEEYVARRPGRAGDLRGLLAMLAALRPLRSAVMAGGTVPPGGGVTPAASAAGSGELPHVPGFEILDEIGRGGMGVVYRARQVSLSRVVALKMILAGDHAGADARTRFLAEAEIVARLDHPHIVRVHEFGEHDGRPFFALEFAPDGGLDRLLAAGPLPARDAARLARDLARGAAHAHERGVLHRDLKPANVLLWPGAVPKVADFGLAKLADAAAGPTTTGSVLGTPNYMAPEQAAGRPATPAADVYALGAILYECLTGRPPFRGATALDTLDLVRRAAPVPVRALQPAVPADLETVALKCLEKDAAARYPSAAALADDLDRFLAGHPTVARPVGPAGRLARWCRRNPRPAALVGGAVAALVAVAVGSAVAAVQFRASQQRAELAEGEAEDRLKAALLAEAKAARVSGRAGQRLRALEALKQAAELARRRGATAAERAALRDEVIAALALCDVRTGPDGVVPTVPPELEVEQGRLAFDADYETVAVPEPDGLRLHATTDGRLVRRLAVPMKGGVPNGALGGIRFTPDGRHLTVLAANNELLVLDTHTGAVTGRVAGVTRGDAVDVAKDGTTLLVGCRDGTARLLALPDARELRRVAVGGPVLAAALSWDGTRAAVWGDGVNYVHVFQTADPARFVNLRVDGKSNWPHALAWHPHPHNRWLGLNGGGNDYPQLRDVDLGHPICLYHGHGTTVASLSYDPTGEFLVTFSYDNTSRVFDGLNGIPYLLLPAQVGHPRFSRDGRYFGYQPGPRTVRVLELVRPAEYHRLRADRAGGFPAASVDPDGHLILEHTPTGLHVFDRRAARWLATVGPGAPENTTVEWAADGRELVAASEAGYWWRWPVAQAGGVLRIGPPDRLDQRGRGVDFVGYHPDGRLIRRADGRGAAFADPSGRRPPAATGHVASSGYVALSPDGRLMAETTWFDRFVDVWATDTGTRVRRLETGDMTAVVFAPDGKHLVTSRGDGLTFRDTATWAVVKTIDRTGATQPAAVAFDPTGTVMAAEEVSGTITLRAYPTGDVLARLDAPLGEATFFNRGLHFTAGGGELVSHARANKGLRTWNLRLIRSELAALGLDWDAPPLPPDDAPPDRVEVVGVEMANDKAWEAAQFERDALTLLGNPFDPAANARFAERTNYRCGDAFARATLAVVQTPDNAAAWAARARAAVALERWTDAEASARAALRLAPRTTGASFHLGQALQNTGRHQEAVAAFTAELAAHPRDPWARNCRVLSLRALGRVAEAAADESAATAPGSPGYSTDLPIYLLTRPAAWCADDHVVRLTRRNSAGRGWDNVSQFAHGLALYRTGDHLGALAVLGATARRTSGHSFWVYAALYVPVCMHRLGEPGAAAEFDRILPRVRAYQRGDQRHQQTAFYLSEAQAAFAAKP
ncbi:WD40 repeat domain-containing serine/threonine protein kinase [Urbifossiella limnaea]|uniref:Serine/threonine-protein kinase StkP n=1 Tax=Urbifossiella limnaea TaxID=2528023 RepID=A0A517Y268_9BACT|nr:serine/threonine-protein kinase [Urbifossiella limnaea]QDU23852.1 Serine/threonine-protein kinase StkP [Urbifossiella limnaea]